MAWNAKQWTQFCELLDKGWPGEFSADARAAYRVLLDHVAPEAAVAAVRVLLHRGQRFRPSAAELLVTVREDPSRPSFEEAYAALYGRGGIIARHENDAALERATDFHPLIASFVVRYGIDRLRTVELFDPDYGELRRRELHEAWDRHVEACEGREVAALAQGTGREGLRKLDPLAALGISSDAPALPPGEPA